jgi:hypothetical protein
VLPRPNCLCGLKRANADGKLDLVVPAFGANTVSVLLGNGDGTFQPAVSYPVDSGPNRVVAADLNGDSTLDLIVANYLADTVDVLLGNGGFR